MRYLLDNDVFFAAIYDRHTLHVLARKWLDAAKPAGWGIASETYLAAVRLLMNPAVMKSGQLTAAQALHAIGAELGGRHPGQMVMAQRKPDPKLLKMATGHKRVMDFWFAQIAADHGCKLATNDGGLAVAWPNIAEKIS